MSCTCNLSLANTGSSCTPIIEEARQYVFVPTFKEDGTRNYIDTTVTLDTAYWNSQLNAASEERWRPTLAVNLVTDERGDSITQDLGAGKVSFIAEGARTVSATMVGKFANAQLLGKLKAFKCADISAYVITRGGSIVGTVLGGDDSKLYPIRLEDETFEPKLIKQSVNNSVQQGISLAFTWAIEEKDENLRQIVEEEMVDPVSGIKGLIDVYGAVSAISTTSFKMTLTNDYGTPINKGLVKGLLITDFSLEEVSPTPASITILTATESPDGVYTLTFAAQTSGDVLKLTPAKDGFDFTAVEAVVITIP